MIRKFLAQNLEDIHFSDVIEFIDEHYSFTPTAFKNGETYNEANQNNGSCKIFAFAQMENLNQDETLSLFGDFYTKDVLGNPEGNDHQNIRNFMKFGWEGIEFEGIALVKK